LTEYSLQKALIESNPPQKVRITQVVSSPWVGIRTLLEIIRLLTQDKWILDYGHFFEGLDSALKLSKQIEFLQPIIDENMKTEGYF